MGWWFEGSLGVTAHPRVDPSDADWLAYLQSIRGLEALSQMRTLVVSDGGAPNAKQRREMTLVFDGASPERSVSRTAILTSSPAMRLVGTAIGWFNPNLRVFERRGFADAYAWMGLGVAERQRVEDGRRRLLAAL